MNTSGSQPFYDPLLTYEDNYKNGPFGLFRDFSSILGFPVDLPFGIAAGPLLNSRFIEAAWKWGFSIATYKTVRGNSYPCHPFPNVIKVHARGGNILPGETVIGSLDMFDINIANEGITNSFGVPSQPAEIWQTDVRLALSKMRTGELLILSFMGTKTESMTFDEYVGDFVRTTKLAKETGAPVLEVNFSCPNVGKEGLICNDVATSRMLLEAMRPAIGNTPLLVKIGYVPGNQQENLEALLEAIHQNANGVVAINTIQAKVTDSNGNQILPGSPVRLSSGICGSMIRWAGLEMAQRIVEYKKRKGWKDFVVVGVGGVVSPNDYFRYMKLGVDAVQSATGAMWRPSLAQEIRLQPVNKT